MTMLTSTSPHSPLHSWRGAGVRLDMAFPARLAFTPFVVVVGSKYFLPVPECLLFGQEYFMMQGIIFYCA